MVHVDPDLILLADSYANSFSSEDQERLKCLRWHPDSRIAALGKSMKLPKNSPLPSLKSLCEFAITVGTSAGKSMLKKGPKR